MRSFAFLAALLIVAPRPAIAQRPLKIYISVDMEGIAGVVTGEQLGPSGFEYGKAREFMTAEVNAAIAGARAAGASEFVISDSHGNGQNLLIDQLPPDVVVIRSWPRPLMMMEGIDSTFDAAMFIGYHASTANPTGVRAHTMSSATLMSGSLFGLHGFVRRGDRVDDLLVAGAAAQVALDRAAEIDRLSVGLFAERVARLHHDARRAEPALHRAVLGKARP